MFKSYKMKWVKLDNVIYEKVINIIEIKPQNIVFFDDNEKMYSAH